MKIFLTVVSIIIGLSLVAQSPQALNYQAVARNVNGVTIANQPIKVQFTIRNLSASGNIVYQETDTATTNQFGLFSTQIGNGLVQQGSFANIAWANGAKFLNVAFDPSGGNNFIDMGTTQLVSVPYSLYSDSAGKTAKQTISLNHDTLSLSNGGNVNLGVYRDTFHYPNLSLHNDSLSIEHGNTVHLPYNSALNFDVKVNGHPITDSAIDLVMVDRGLFLTKTNYKIYANEAFSGDWKDSVILDVLLPVVFADSNCSNLHYYAYLGNIIAGRIGWSYSDNRVYYIPHNTVPVTVPIINVYDPNSGTCTANNATITLYEIFPNDPSVTGYNLGRAFPIDFIRKGF